MERALESGDWLVENRFSMADIAMSPYVNRLAALSMEGIWQNGRLPRVEDWFERIRARQAFKPALLSWMPSELAAEMRKNGKQSWAEVSAILDVPG
jgi:glutathione S-transferase